MLTPSKTFSSFSVTNIDEAKDFYTNTLGLTVTEDRGMGIQLHLSDGALVYLYPKENHAPATFTVLNFVVDNIDEAVDQLTAKGISFEQYGNKDLPQDEKGVMRGLDVGQGPNIAWFTDPAGNILSVLQEK